MSKLETALIIYPNQLFEYQHLPGVDVVYVVEEPLFFGTDEEYPIAFHKQKLVMQRAAMRRYVEEHLWPNDVSVEYIELHQLSHTSDILMIAQKAGVNMVQMFDPNDYAIEKRLHDALETIVESPFELKVLPSPSFMLRRGEVEEYFEGQTAFKFAPFYQWQRERFNILIDKKYKPVGGKWSFDTENRKALPVGHVPPGFASFGDNNYVKEATKWVEKRFPNNPGNLESFLWPTNHQEAKRWLSEFIAERISDFGPYEDAIDGQAMLLYHSGISAPLNCGLITPVEVIEAALAAHNKKPVPMPSLEGFIRQIIGWREYVRALYVLNGVEMRNSNKLENHRQLNSAWWTGDLGVPPVDDVIKKVNNHAYAHHIERLMVVGNFMLLCDIDPTEVYKWYMSLFIDAYDWVMVPNVYGMSQFSDLGSMVTKPYISGSKYILNMSHYQKDLWCDIWDGLFWQFVEKHQELLLANPRTSMMPHTLKRLNPDHHRIIGYRAKDFLDSIS